MIIADKSVLVTGANRGLGQALVAEPSSRGAARLYAGTRQPLAREDPRVTAVALDVTNTAQIEAAVAEVESLDILMNNAGIGLYDDLSDRSGPLLTRSQGAIVNVLSNAAVAALPVVPAYSISKAAAFSLSQSLRALLDSPKASRESVANAVFAALL